MIVSDILTQSCRPPTSTKLQLEVRRRFLSKLHQTYTAGALTLEGQCHPLTDPSQWQRFLSPLRATNWWWGSHRIGTIMTIISLLLACYGNPMSS